MVLARRGRAAFVGSVLLAVRLLVFETPDSAAAADEARYSRDQVLLEPDSEFLTIHAEGGMTTTVRTYSLRGDGQLTIFSTGNASGTPQLVYTEHLSDEEVGGAVDAIMKAALYEFDEARVRAKQRAETNPGGSISDAGSLQVEIHLSLFPGTNPSGADEINHAFGVSLSDMEEGHFPSIIEYEALRQIFTSFRRAERRARVAAGVLR